MALTLAKSVLFKPGLNNALYGTHIHYNFNGNASKGCGVVYYYFNGYISTGFLFNGKLEETQKSYYGDGQLVNIFYSKNDKREGEYREYYENGQIEKIYKYKNDKLKGINKEYYENGRLNIIYYGFFKGYKKYDENGNLIQNGKFQI